VQQPVQLFHPPTLGEPSTGPKPVDRQQL
jgi:hypothetical protein